jgi:ABC-type dipeptide/oligopeptide/nickel transport system permease component
MLGYLFRRLAQGVVFMILATLLTYTVLVVLMPQGPKAGYDNLMSSYTARGGKLDPRLQRELDFLTKQYKVDKPWPISYLAWLFDPGDTTQLDGDFNVVQKGIDFDIFGLEIKGSGILTGDFGKSNSYAVGVPVAQLFSDRWDHTVLLVVYALVVTVLVALPLGILGAVRYRKGEDHLTTLISFAGMSMPAFVSGILFIIFLSVMPTFWRNSNSWSWLPSLPPGGLGERGDWGDRIYHMTLPAITLAIPQIGWLARYMRSSLLNVMTQDYIRTAWAKGISRRAIVLKHALRNALLPTITLVALAVPSIVSTSDQ